MRPLQCKRRGGVIEAASVGPGDLRVARSACPRGFGVGCQSCSFKLFPVRVAVAAGTGEIREMKRNLRNLCRDNRGLVALAARHRRVSAEQGEPQRCVLTERERRRLETSYRMAALATLEVRRGAELALVRVAVTVLTFGMLHAVLGHLLPLDVTFFAGDRLMLADQGIVRALMAIQREGGGLETALRVAGRAFTTVRPVQKLVFVGLGSRVAVQTSGVGQRLRERSASMTPRTFHGLVFSDQRELGAGMIKT